MNADERKFAALTEQVLGAIFEVSNTLGAGFLEKVYERALVAELKLRGLRVRTQVPFAISESQRRVEVYRSRLLDHIRETFAQAVKPGIAEDRYRCGT